ncbi:MAG: OmpA family protein [Salibacteraceae bacterium]
MKNWVKLIVKNIIFLIILSLFFTLNSSAQQTNDSIINLSEKEMQKLWSLGDFPSLIEQYSLKLKEDSNNADALYNLGAINVELTTDLEQSLVHLEKVLDLEKQSEFPEFFYYLARSYHYNHRYFFALAAYNTYLYTLPEDKKNQETRREIEFFISKAENGTDLLEKDSTVFNRFVTLSDHRVLYFTEGLKYIEITNMGSPVNSAFSEYGPVIFSKQKMLLFTSRRKADTEADVYFDGQHYEDIYSSTENRGNWNKVVPVDSLDFFNDKLINSKDHEATVSLSEDEKTLLIFKENSIFLMQQDSNDVWSELEKVNKIIRQKLPYINGASISSSGNLLVVSATNPEDKENSHLDLFSISKNEDGKWGDLINMGTLTNTPYDETSPFIFDDSTIYFSSNSAASIGEYDVFISKKTNNNWQEPKNLGVPINSAYNEVNYSIGTDNSYAFLASDRPNGYGKYDIYRVTKGYDFQNQYAYRFAKSEDDDITSNNDEKSSDVNDSELAKNADSDSGSENNSTASVAVNRGADSNGSGSSIKGEGSGVNESNLSTLGPTGNSDAPLKPIKELRLYFDFDKSELGYGEKVRLNELIGFIKQNPKASIYISGHTDSKGNEDYNYNLSVKRAESAKSLILEKGVTNKIRTFGFGESAPFIKENSEENQAANRLVHIKLYE